MDILIRPIYPIQFITAGILSLSGAIGEDLEVIFHQTARCVLLQDANLSKLKSHLKMCKFLLTFK